MKEFYDKLFDTLIALFILICILSSIVMIVSTVVFTIQTGQHHTGMTVSSAILVCIAIAVIYFYLSLIQAKRTDDKE